MFPHRSFVVLFVGILCLIGAGDTANAAPPNRRLPLFFESNQGQTDPAVRFLTRGDGYTLFLTPAETVMAVAGAKPGTEPESLPVVRTRLLDADPSAAMAGVDPLPGRVNYFRGSDRSQWKTGVATFARVKTRDVYPGIDLVHYGNDGVLEYDFVVAAGADPARIRFEIDGADRVTIDEASGDLVVSVGGHDLRWKKPDCYQDIDGGRRIVEGRFRRSEANRFSFELASYDRSLPLVIDPTLAYATFVAPTTFVAGDGLQNHGLAVTADSNGNAYVVGLTESASFPTTAGALRTTRIGKTDVFVAKLNPTGSALDWSTYLGGSDTEIQNTTGSIGVAIDDIGNVYVTGATKSTNFPTTVGAYQTTIGGDNDAFVTKIAADGASLLYSTYLGGIGLDYGFDIALDSDGNAYTCGYTNGHFPTTPGAFQTDSTFQSAWAAKLSANGSTLVYSTTLGVNMGQAHSIVVDESGNAFLTGFAEPPHGLSFYPTTEGSFQPAAKGSFDAFITKLDPAGSALVYSSFLGGLENEDGRGIAIDGAGNAYVTGVTNSTDFPASVGAYQTTFQSTPTPQDDGFVAKVNPAGSALVYATYLGASLVETPEEIVVDATGSAIVVGATTSMDYPTTNDAFQTTYTYSSFSASAYLTKLNPTGTALAYSTFLHPTDTTNKVSFAYGLAIDTDGAAYVTGTSSATFPTTIGAFQTTTFNPGFGGPFVAKLAGIASTALCGDANGDGKITAADALFILRASVASSACPVVVCDFTGDNKVTAADALAVLRIAVGQMVTAKCPTA